MNNERDQTIEVVLFDMGGVLVQLGDLATELGVADMSSQQFWDRWLTSPSVRALERGDGTVDGFAEGLIAEFDLAMERHEVIARFAAVTRGLFPGAVEMVRSVPDHVRTGLLSNTNEVHWETQPGAEIMHGLCQHEFLSFRLGLMKPDRDIFEYVIADLGTEAQHILFIDDNMMNVDGARAAGLCSELAKGPQEAAAVLSGYGLG